MTSAVVRKAAFTGHVAFSVGWMGAIGAYLALAIAGLAGSDAPSARSAYVSMELVGWAVLVPCSLAALLSGFVQSYVTEWGLLRYTWVVAKLALTVAATIVLITHMDAVGRMSHVAALNALTGELTAQRIQLVVHAAGGLAILLAITVLSVFKPWGRVPWRFSRRGLAIAGGIAALVLIILLHLLGGGPHGH